MSTFYNNFNNFQASSPHSHHSSRSSSPNHPRPALQLNTVFYSPSHPESSNPSPVSDQTCTFSPPTFQSANSADYSPLSSSNSSANHFNSFNGGGRGSPNNLSPDSELANVFSQMTGNSNLQNLLTMGFNPPNSNPINNNQIQNPSIQINSVDHQNQNQNRSRNPPQRRQATVEIKNLTTDLLRAVKDGNSTQIQSLISEFMSISVSEPPSRRQRIFSKQIERLSRKDTEEYPSASPSSAGATGVFWLEGDAMPSTAEPMEISTSAPAHITGFGGFGGGSWLNNFQNQVGNGGFSNGNGFDGGIDTQRLSANTPSPYPTSLGSPNSSFNSRQSPIDHYSPINNSPHSISSEIPIVFEPHFKYSSFFYPAPNVRQLDPKGWRMRSSKSERRVYWFQITQNEGDWYLEVGLRSRDSRKIETEDEFEKLKAEEDMKPEEDRDFKYIKFAGLPRFWIREKTTASREILPLNKNDFGEFIKCCSLYYGNCSSNGHCFSFYDIPPDKSCICDEGEDDKVVRLKKQPFKRPAIIADHVGECLRFKDTGFGELCKVKRGWADEDRQNGVGGEGDEGDEDERPKKPVPKRKGSAKPGAGKPKKPKFEDPMTLSDMNA